MERQSFIKSFLALIILVFPLGLRADVFSVNAKIENIEENTDTFNKIEDLFASFESAENITNLLASYNELSPASFDLNVRGLPATATYIENSQELTFRVPSLGIDLSFTGATRDDSQDMFTDFLEADGDDILQRMLQELVATTPIDPVAGNPNSAVARMGMADFGFGTDFNMGPAMAPSDVNWSTATRGGSGTLSTGGTSTDGGPRGGAGPVGEQSTSAWSLGLSAGRFSAGEYDNELISLPIQYTRYGEDPRRQLRISMPISYIDTEGSTSYNASLGIGYRFPIVNDDWSLTPAARVGAVGSEDLGSAAIVYSASLTSNYNFYLEDLKIALGNMVGYYATSSLDAGDYEIDYDLQNGMTKNGLSFEGSTGRKLLSQPTSWQVAGTWTLFWGDDLFIEEFYDIAVTWGTRLTNVSASTRTMRFGLTYTVGEHDFDGFRLNFGYTF
jgi:hypothetical protein